MSRIQEIVETSQWMLDQVERVGLAYDRQVRLLRLLEERREKFLWKRTHLRRQHRRQLRRLLQQFFISSSTEWTSP